MLLCCVVVIYAVTNSFICVTVSDITENIVHMYLVSTLHTIYCYTNFHMFQ